ncbi:MAG: hypothetical protein JWM34_1120 [Ilumatobacteraceae bacterium]|nr:hypothetical protein [Ilumatobacteraceae bacterium]
MMRTLLIRGLLAGLIAGICGFAIAKTIGEPQVDKAIAFESYVNDTVLHEPPEADLVSRTLQSSAGLGTGALIYGIALGGIFAIAFAFVYGRAGLVSAKPTAALLGFLGFVGIYLAPVLKYPANPPSIGNPDTIGRRSALFLVMILCSVVSMVAAGLWWRRLTDRISRWNATLIAGATYIVAMIVVYLVLPGVSEIPQAVIPGVVRAYGDGGVTFPPTVLWKFRMASIAIQAVLWMGIALAFGIFASKVLERGTVTDDEYELEPSGV